MRRRDILTGAVIGLGAVLGSARFVMAQDYVAEIVQMLRDEGYGAITTKSTLLGRVRILAEGTEVRREIIVNPRTGEILRDLVLGLDGTVLTDGRGGDDDGSDDDSDSESDDDSDDDSSSDDSDDSSDSSDSSGSDSSDD